MSSPLIGKLNPEVAACGPGWPRADASLQAVGLSPYMMAVWTGGSQHQCQPAGGQVSPSPNRLEEGLQNDTCQHQRPHKRVCSLSNGHTLASLSLRRSPTVSCLLLGGSPKIRQGPTGNIQFIAFCAGIWSKWDFGTLQNLELCTLLPLLAHASLVYQREKIWASSSQ